MRISDSGRYLIDDDGSPFFFLGENIRRLFSRPAPEEVDRCLEDRHARQIQTSPFRS